MAKSLVSMMGDFLMADPFAGPRQQTAAEQAQDISNMKNGRNKYLLNQKIVSPN
jgi:hypothetical protein